MIRAVCRFGSGPRSATALTLALAAGLEAARSSGGRVGFGAIGPRSATALTLALAAELEAARSSHGSEGM